MRLILEGGCGTGKSALAKAISAQTGVPVYRPFRGNAEHIHPEVVKSMQDLGLSVNGWEEDLYVADLLANLHSASVILDRSMPSALAWNPRSDHALGTQQRAAVLRLWGERIVAARATLVLVHVSDAVRAQRTTRGGSWEVKAIAEVVVELSRMFGGVLPIWMVNGDSAQPDVLADAVVRRAMLGTVSNLVHTL